MTKKQNLFTFFGLGIIAIGALLLFYAGDRHSTAVVGSVPNTTFEIALKSIENDAVKIEKVIFLRDPNGTIQQVQIIYKSPEQAPLRARTSDDKTTIRLMEASNKSGLATEIVNAKVEGASELKSASIFLMIVQVSVPLGAIIVLTWLARRENRKSAGNQSGSRQGGRSQMTPQQAAGEMTKSSMIEIKADQDRKTFADVAGCDEAKQELQDVVRYLRNKGLLEELGGKPYKGVLLAGKPGNGKTLLAKAVAGEAGVKFFAISASQFVEMYVGVGAARVHDTFEKIRKEKPAILFIDELDAIGRQRSTGMGATNEEREGTLNQLLVEMDGFTDNDGILLIAATNRADILDPALVRPGRFGDLQVYVDHPDKKGRADILKIHTRKKKLAPDVDLDSIASKTPGFSGAELEGLTNHAAFLAVRRIVNSKAEMSAAGKSEQEIVQLVPHEITMKDLDEGADRVIMGPAKEGLAKRISAENMLQTAVHELGHAWIAQSLFEQGQGGNPVTKITIVPRARALGYTQSMPLDDRFNYTDKDLRANIMMAMGGRVAQELFLQTIDTGASNDFKQAKAWAYRMVTEFGMSGLGPISVAEGGSNPFLSRAMPTENTIGPALMDRIDDHWLKLVNECYEEAKQILGKDKDSFLKIVERLLEVETMVGSEFTQLRNELIVKLN